MLPTKQTNWAGVYYLISRVLMQKNLLMLNGTHPCNTAGLQCRENEWQRWSICSPLLQLSPSFRPWSCVFNNWRGEHQDLVRYCIHSTILNNQVMNIKVEMQSFSCSPPYTKFSRLPSAKADYIKLHFFSFTTIMFFNWLGTKNVVGSPPPLSNECAC